MEARRLSVEVTTWTESLPAAMRIMLLAAADTAEASFAAMPGSVIAKTSRIAARQISDASESNGMSAPMAGPLLPMLVPASHGAIPVIWDPMSVRASEAGPARASASLYCSKKTWPEPSCVTPYIVIAPSSRRAKGGASSIRCDWLFPSWPPVTSPEFATQAIIAGCCAAAVASSTYNCHGEVCDPAHTVAVQADSGTSMRWEDAACAANCLAPARLSLSHNSVPLAGVSFDCLSSGILASVTI